MEPDLVNRIEAELARIKASPDEMSQPKWEVEAKRQCLEDMLARNKECQRLTMPKVFISYTGDFGQEIMSKAANRVRGIKAFGADSSFGFSSGMSLRGNGKSRVLPHILENMKSCCLFVGILTRESQIATSDGSDKFAPGAWVLIETGMAISAGLDVTLFIDKSIKEEFWQPYLAHHRNVWFEQNSYIHSLDPLMDVVEQAYSDLRDVSKKRHP